MAYLLKARDISLSKIKSWPQGLVDKFHTPLTDFVASLEEVKKRWLIHDGAAVERARDAVPINMMDTPARITDFEGQMTDPSTIAAGHFALLKAQLLQITVIAEPRQRVKPGANDILAWDIQSMMERLRDAPSGASDILDGGAKSNRVWGLR